MGQIAYAIGYQHRARGEKSLAVSRYVERVHHTRSRIPDSSIGNNSQVWVRGHWSDLLWYWAEIFRKSEKIWILIGQRWTHKVAKVQVGKEELLRPITKLCQLEPSWTCSEMKMMKMKIYRFLDSLDVFHLSGQSPLSLAWLLYWHARHIN